MKFKPDRAPVFLQLLAHRERWLRRGESFAFRNQELGEVALKCKPSRLLLPRCWRPDSAPSAATPGNSTPQ